jgi:phthalate 4,5-dioxygenase reductase subunit
MNSPARLRPLRVSAKRQIAQDIFLFELRDPEGGQLEAFTAGAHLPVQVPSGAMRHYSLCGDPQQIDLYQLAVKRDAAGRGGSISLVDQVKEGDLLMTGEPENSFALDPKAKNFILVGGGIGITPMMAMVRELRAEELRAFKLYYLTRDPEATAFLEELKALDLSSQVVIHHDFGEVTRSFDLWKIFEKVSSGTHVYCCGPKGLMESVKDMTGHWPSGAIHFESFGANTQPHDEDQAFEVELHSSGKRIQVGKRQSILEALRANDVHVPSSCESGTCGSCKVRLLKGHPQHRDLVLMPEEQSNQLMVCVSRSEIGGCLVLDL